MQYASYLSYTDPYRDDLSGNPEAINYTVKFDELIVGRFYITGRCTLTALYDPEAGDGEEYTVVDLVDISELEHLDEDGNETPLHMLCDRPTVAEIIAAVNKDIVAWSAGFVEA